MTTHRPLLSNDEIYLICKALAFYQRHLERNRDGRDFSRERMCKNLGVNLLMLRKGDRKRAGRRRKFPLWRSRKRKVQ